MATDERMVAQCQRELLNLFPETEHALCPEFLDAYWSGEDLRPDDSRYLYNICSKRFESMFEAVLTGKFSPDCQARYVDTVIAKLGQLFGFKKGRLIGNALLPFRHDYLPPIFVYTIFTLDEPVYLTRMDLAWDNTLLKDLVSIWERHELMRPSPFHAPGYYYLKFSLKKALPTYLGLTKVEDVVELREQLAQQDLARFFIQGIRKTIQEGNVRVPMSLLEIFVVGFIFRVVTRSRKIKSFLSESSLKRFIWTFGYRSGIEDNRYLDELYRLLFDIASSEFIRSVVEGKLAAFMRRESA